MNYGIVIPALNAAPHLPELVRRIRAVAAGVPVLLIDDGSTDKTRDVAQALNTIVLNHESTRGKGAALKTGFARALAMNCDAVVQMDADLQHQPESLPGFFARFESGDCDLIVGSRNFHDKAMPWPRRLSNTMTSWAVSRACGMAIPDSQCGYRLISSKVLRTVQPESDAFDFETELLLQAAQTGFRIGSIPVTTVYGNERSAIRPWRDTWRFIKLMGLFWRTRPGDRTLAQASGPERSD